MGKCILTRCYSDSDLDADRGQRELSTLLLGQLDYNRELTCRLARLQDCFGSGSNSDSRQSIVWAGPRPQDGPGSKVGLPGEGRALRTLESSDYQYEFKGDLEASRVYRKAQRVSTDYSFRSSVALSHAWSALSDVSLSDVSNISTVALPVTFTELANGYHYKPKTSHANSAILFHLPRIKSSDGSPSPKIEYQESSSPSIGSGPTPGSKGIARKQVAERQVASLSQRTAIIREAAEDPLKKSYKEHKIVVVGAGGVGKSSMIIQVNLNKISGFMQFNV